MTVAAFVIATLCVLALSAFVANRDLTAFGDVLVAAQLQTLVLALSVIPQLPLGGAYDPRGMEWLAPLDLGAVAFAVAWFWGRAAWWKFALVAAYVAQLATHAGFWAAGAGLIAGWRMTPEMVYTYKASLNALAIVQLAAIAWPGGRYVASALGVGLLPDRLRALHLGDGARR